MVTMEENEMTALQWAKKGYIPNADAIGAERWTNCYHTQKATYYKSSEVHKDAEAAREIIKQKRKEYNQALKIREEKREKAIAFRELMKTEWQWLQEGRIPNPNARWECGETLNNTFNVCSYGSSYCYCHIDDTHIPIDSEELQNAIEEYQKQ